MMAEKSNPGRVVSTATVLRQWPKVVELLGEVGELVVTNHGEPVMVMRPLTPDERAIYGRAA